MKKILLYTMVFSMAFLGAVTVQAEDEVLVDPVVYDEGTPVPELIASEPEEVKNPSNIGLWWVGVKESFTMAFTFNPEKRIERALAFADRRMELAEIFAQNAETEEAQAKAERMIQKAESFIERAEGSKLKVSEEVQKKLAEQKANMEERKQKLKEFHKEKAGLIQQMKDGNKDVYRECLEYRYSTCPDYCEKVCISSSCSEMDEDGNIICTDDCDGLGSCVGEVDDMKGEMIELNKSRHEEIMGIKEDMKKAHIEERVGGDKDEHGCIGSAGYLWCKVKGECLRPWEDEWDESCDSLEDAVDSLSPIRGFKSQEPLDDMIKEKMKKVKDFLNTN